MKNRRRLALPIFVIKGATMIKSQKYPKQGLEITEEQERRR